MVFTKVTSTERSTPLSCFQPCVYAQLYAFLPSPAILIPITITVIWNYIISFLVHHQAFTECCCGTEVFLLSWSVGYPEWQHTRHSVSHMSHTWFFYIKHMVNQGWGKKGMPVLCYIYRVDISEEDSCTHTHKWKTHRHTYMYMYL